VRFRSRLKVERGLVADLRTMEDWPVLYGQIRDTLKESQVGCKSVGGWLWSLSVKEEKK